MTTVAIIQARTGSTRFPRKVLQELAPGWTLLQQVVSRVKQVVPHVVVAHPDTDVELRDFCRAQKIPHLPGDEHDVLSRYYEVSRRLDARRVVRVTADCPFVDPALIDSLLALQEHHGDDYVGVATIAVEEQLAQRKINGWPGHYFPDGLDAEVMTLPALRRAWAEALTPTQREHVTPYIWTNPDIFRCHLLWQGWNRAAAQYRLTVDTPADLTVARAIHAVLATHDPMSGEAWKAAVQWLMAHPDVAAVNGAVTGTDYGAIR